MKIYNYCKLFKCKYYINNGTLNYCENIKVLNIFNQDKQPSFCATLINLYQVQINKDRDIDIAVKTGCDFYNKILIIERL